LTDTLLDTFAEFDTIEIAPCFCCCESIAKRRVGGLAFSVSSDGLLHHFPVLAARAASANPFLDLLAAPALHSRRGLNGLRQAPTAIPPPDGRYAHGQQRGQRLGVD